MFLSFFYIIFSYLKMWQLQTIRTKLLQHISSSSCIAFYKISEVAEDFISACSSHCVEPNKAYISELLFAKNTKYGCSLKPLQYVCLSTWKAPPPNPIRIAFLPDVQSSLCQELEKSKPSTSSNVEIQKEYIDVLIECELGNEDTEQINILPAYGEESNIWKLVAWKAKDTNLSLALNGDITNLTVLAATFLNYETPVTRIMSVKFEGSPIKLNEAECKSLSHGNIKGSPRHCFKYISMLQNISNDVPTEDKTTNIIVEPKVSKNNYVEKVEKIEQTESSEDENLIVTQINDKCVTQLESSHSKEKIIHEKENGTVEVQVDKSEKHNSHSHKINSRKSDLKLDLNNKTNDKNHSKPNAKLNLNKNTQSKLDGQLTNDKKSRKLGASCPSLPTVKPPNILIYSESAVTQENILRTLKSVLDPDRYAIYCTGDEIKLEEAGPSGTALLVAGGALTARSSAALLSALLGGARVLSLCSDLLISVLPFYQTAEVRERELVSFTYENWKSVKLLHHVFCYQASPARRQFSAGPNTHPTEYKGHGNHVLTVEVLAAEQTWHTPSLLRATDDQNGGMAVFSQVHLELDSREYLGDEAASSEKARLGVLRKILGNLGLSTAPSPIVSLLSSEPMYTPAYFLGTYERKQEAAESVAVGCLHLVLPKNIPPIASSTITPLLLHACPDNYSTLLYFQELATKDFGRLLIYSDVLSSTQAIINERTRAHGLVIVADRQTKGFGRGGTIWLSPPGCLMFSLQVIANVKDNMITSRPALFQHLAALACILAIRKMTGYENIDIRIKWPNDIYFGTSVKLGGIVVNTSIMGNLMVFNIGIGINLDNKIPTRCLNNIILEQNAQLAPLEREKLIAHILNHLEYFYKSIEQTGDFGEFYELYYKYWLHSDQEVSVIQDNTDEKECTACKILGIDENGYLEASGPSGTITLMPDGNTFDMMKGLIAPKIKL